MKTTRFMSCATAFVTTIMSVIYAIYGKPKYPSFRMFDRHPVMKNDPNVTPHI